MLERSFFLAHVRRFATWSVLLGAFAVCARFGFSMLWAIGLIALVVAAGLYAVFRDRRAARPHAREETVDEWIIELDGDDLGRLTNAIFTDMFWKTYTVIGDDPRLFDDSLWETSRFSFRHAISGRQPAYALCGGLRPTRDAPQVVMRGLY